MSNIQASQDREDGLSCGVAMAVYNGAAYLGDQLDSIINQSVKLQEIVIVDDASTDDSASIVNAYKKHFHRFVFITNTKNQGYIKSFQSAISNIQSKIIFLSDQDDVWHKDKVSVVLSCFEKSSSISCVKHDMRLVDRDLQVLSSSFIERLHKQGRGSDFLVKGCSIAFRRKFLDVAMPFPVKTNWAHDDWIILLSQTLGVLQTIDRALMDHRIHGKNASGKIPKVGFHASVERFLQWLIYGSNAPASIAYKGIEEQIVLKQRIKDAVNLNADSMACLDEVIDISSCRDRICHEVFHRRIMLLIRLFLKHPASSKVGINGFLKDAFFSRNRST